MRYTQCLLIFFGVLGGWTFATFYHLISKTTTDINTNKNKEIHFKVSAVTGIPNQRNENNNTRDVDGPVNGVKKRRVKFVIAVWNLYLEERAQLIRDTWASLLDMENSAYFIFREQHDEQSIPEKWKLESEKHNDLLFFYPTDKVHPRTQMMEKTLRYAYENFEFDYFVKLEDDTFFNPVALEKLSKTWPSEYLYTGRCWTAGFEVGADPTHFAAKGGHYEPHYLDCVKYPPFCIAAESVLSWDLVHWILSSNRKLRFLTDEDTSIGLWLASVDNCRAKDDPEHFTLVNENTNGHPETIPNKLWTNLTQYVALTAIPDATLYKQYFNHLKELLKIEN